MNTLESLEKVNEQSISRGQINRLGKWMCIILPDFDISEAH